MELLHKEITDKIINAFYKVYNELGFGFLEKVYQNALYLELLELDLICEKHKQIKVYYNGKKVGEYYADILVNDLVIIELKAAESIAEEHELQLINYLKATDLEVGLLLNFGKSHGLKGNYLQTTERKSNQLKSVITVSSVCYYLFSNSL